MHSLISVFVLQPLWFFFFFFPWRLFTPGGRCIFSLVCLFLSFLFIYFHISISFVLSTAVLCCSLSPVFKREKPRCLEWTWGIRGALQKMLMCSLFILVTITGDEASLLYFDFCFVLFCFNVETSHSEHELSWQSLNLKSRSSPVSFKMYEDI